MYGDGVGQFQFIQLPLGIGHILFLIKQHRHLLVVGINFLDDTAVSVKDAAAFLYARAIVSTDFPFDLIVVLHLHDFVPLAEQHAMTFYLRFSRCLRI